MPSLGWERAYRSGDLVRNEAAGLVFVGRADDQVKLGGRRIELGEVDSALLAAPGVTGAAAAVRRTASGGTVLVGYVAVQDGFEREVALAISGRRCRRRWCRGWRSWTTCRRGHQGRSTGTRFRGRWRQARRRPPQPVRR